MPRAKFCLLALAPMSTTGTCDVLKDMGSNMIEDHIGDSRPQFPVKGDWAWSI